MKKILLSVFTFMAFSFTTNANTRMCVKTTDDKVIKYDVENVAEVYYESDYEFETEGLLYDSVGIKLYNTPSMTKIPKPADAVKTNYFFEYWYESSDQDNDIATIFEEYKKQATALSTNVDMPIFWSTNNGNTWTQYTGQHWDKSQENFYFTLANKTDPNGDVDEKGQIWAVVVIKQDNNRIRVIVKMDSIKYNGKYYMYDNGSGTPVRH